MSDADSGHDTVFSRRWVLTEDELLQLMWRCHGGENPDVVLVELHTHRRAQRRLRTSARPRHDYAQRGRGPRVTRHYHRRDANGLGR